MELRHNPNKDTATTITLEWTPVQGAQGYRFSSSATVKRSHTWDPMRSSVKFAKGADCYRVEALGVLQEGVYPPPTDTWPPADAWFSDDFDPAPSGWHYEYLGSSVSWPHAGFSVVPDGEGGNALRLSIPAGQGGNAQLAAAYLASGQWGTAGMRQHGRVDVRFPDDYVPAPGVWNWLVEWHEHWAGDTINSCAIGLTDQMRLYMQVSGGPVAGHKYTHLTDTEQLRLNRWYRLRWDITWSPDPAVGRFAVWCDERPVIDVQRGTLLTDGSTVDRVNSGGLYNYHPPAEHEISVDFRRFAIGPTPEAIGIGAPG